MKLALTLAPSQIVVEVREDPTPESDEIVVAMKAAGICGSDVAIQRGPFAGRLSLPRVLGHEWSGEVIAVGEGVTGVEPGDRVVSEEIFWCGHCALCRSGHFDHCVAPAELGFTVDGAFSSHVRLPAHYCHRLPDNVTFEAGALVEPLSVAYNALYLAGGGLQPGQRVVVVGMGPIGMCIGLWAKAAGAYVIGLEPRPYRRRLASTLGVDAVIEGNPRDAVAGKILDSGGEVDFLVEASGIQEMVPTLVSVLRPRGTVILVGHSTRSVEMSLETLVLRGLKMVGSCGQVGQNTYARVIHALSERVIDPRPMITHRFNLDQVPEAFRFALSSEEYGKIIIVPEGVN